MYSFVRNTIGLLIKMFFGLEVEGQENVPQNGGAIIVSNHVSYLDPAVVAAAIERPIHFMAKAELFRNPLLKWLFTSLKAFPVRRGMADRNAIRKAVELVSAGKVLGIFPEGTRVLGNGTLPLQGGAAMIAFKTGVPLIPVVVTGVKQIGLRKSFKLKIGQPISVGEPRKVSKDEIIKASNLISKQFIELKKENT